LRGALDSANDKLREMQQIAEDARVKLAEMNADLLEAKGEDKKAELLRQQIDYQTDLASIEKQRQEAEAAGNQEAVAILNEQMDVLNQINQIKTASIEADKTSSNAVTKTTQQYRDLGSAISLAHSAASGLAGIDMGGLISSSKKLAESSEKIKSNFSDIRGLL
jgi:hypothetical protein